MRVFREECFVVSMFISLCVNVVKSLSRVRLFATPWTVACQAPLSMGFSRQEYRSGLPFPSPKDLPHPANRYLLVLRQHQALFCVVRDLVLNKIGTDHFMWWLKRRSKFGPLKEPMGEIALRAGLWGLSGGANCLMQSLC